MAYEDCKAACRLRVARMAAGMTQEDVAEKIGITAQYLSRLENADYFPAPARIIVRLAELYNCGYDRLYVELERIHSLYFQKQGKKVVLTEAGEAAVKFEEARILERSKKQ